MGILNRLFGVKTKVRESELPAITAKLVAEFGLMRQRFVSALVEDFQSEQGLLKGVSPVLAKASELDSVLKGYQLTCIEHFAWVYMPRECELSYFADLLGRLDEGDRQVILRYYKRYIDCEGDVDSQALASALAEDIHRLWGRPDPADMIRASLAGAAAGSIILTQAVTARVFGDIGTEKHLLRKWATGPQC